MSNDDPDQAEGFAVTQAGDAFYVHNAAGGFLPDLSGNPQRLLALDVDSVHGRVLALYDRGLCGEGRRDRVKTWFPLADVVRVS